MSEAVALTRRAPAPLARTPRRGAHSRGTCRSWRTRARAARCRPAARPPPRPPPPPAAWSARASGHTPSSACSSAAASRPMSTAQRTLPRKAVGERREVLVLALPAEDHDQRTVHAGHRRERRADVGALGVIDVGHAVHVRDPLRAVRRGRRSSAAPRASPPAAARAPRPGRARRARWRRCAGP